jgi:hypothetical protein
MRTTSLHLQLQDVTLQYQVSSRWLFDLIALLTSGPSEMDVEDTSDVIAVESGPAKHSITRVHVTLSHGLFEFSTGERTATSADEFSSRILLSLGLLRLSSNIVSSVTKHTFKVGLRDVSLHLSNQAAANLQDQMGHDGQRSEDLEQVAYGIVGFRNEIVPSDKFTLDQFLDTNRFVQVGR